MPASQAISGMGTYLLRNGVEIAEVNDIGGPEFSAEVIDVTHLRSPNFWREKIASLKDGGELTFSVNFLLTNATHNAATGFLSGFTGTEGPPKDTWAIVFPNGVTWSFLGILTGFSTGATVDDKLGAEVTITIAGAPTLA